MKLRPVALLTYPDRISGLVLVLLGAFLAAVAARLPFGTLRAPDAGFFPLTLASLMLGCGVALLVGSFWSKPTPTEFTNQSLSVALCALAMFLYSALIERAGFIVCTSALLVLLMNRYGGLGWKLSCLIVVPTVIVTFIGFIELGVPLPRGTWIFF
jgi:putative tricarboxylic transport membrane protein